jgi:hypothetical protein
LESLEQSGGLEEVAVEWDEYDAAHCGNAGGEDKVKRILRPKTNDIIHLECASVINASLSAISQRRLINELVTLATYLHSITTSAPALSSDPDDIPRTPIRALIHCHDGYTETSLLALTYIMYSRSICLPEAYLFLQLTADRSFFVGLREVAILEGVEKRVREVLESERDEREHIREEERVARESMAQSQRMARSDSGFESNSSKMSSQSHASVSTILEEGDANEFGVAELEKDLAFNLGQIALTKEGEEELKQGMTRSNMGLPSSSTMSHSASTSTSAGFEEELEPDNFPIMSISNPMDHAWFYGETWEGSFPSRILPFVSSNWTSIAHGEILTAPGIQL